MSKQSIWLGMFRLQVKAHSHSLKLNRNHNQASHKCHRCTRCLRETLLWCLELRVSSNRMVMIHYLKCWINCCLPMDKLQTQCSSFKTLVSTCRTFRWCQWIWTVWTWWEWMLNKCHLLNHREILPLNQIKRNLDHNPLPKQAKLQPRGLGNKFHKVKQESKLRLHLKYPNLKHLKCLNLQLRLNQEFLQEMRTLHKHLNLAFNPLVKVQQSGLEADLRQTSSHKPSKIQLRSQRVTWLPYHTKLSMNSTNFAIVWWETQLTSQDLRCQFYPSTGIPSTFLGLIWPIWRSIYSVWFLSCKDVVILWHERVWLLTLTIDARQQSCA